MVAPLMKTLSDLKSRRVNDISLFIHPAAERPEHLLRTSLWRFRDRRKIQRWSNGAVTVVAFRLDRSGGTSEGTNGIAIRACFGKPAF
jgi:hypothetical protein